MNVQKMIDHYCRKLSNETGMQITAQVFIKRDVSDDTIKLIRKAVCEFSGITLDEFESEKRYPKLVDARRLFVYYILSNYKISLNGLAEFIGGRNHATIINLRDTMKDYITMYPSQRDLYEKFDRRATALLSRKVERRC